MEREKRLIRGSRRGLQFDVSYAFAYDRLLFIFFTTRRVCKFWVNVLTTIRNIAGNRNANYNIL